MKTCFSDWSQSLPLVAILRGIESHEAEHHVGALIEAGFTMIEVPLNSPDPFTSIVRLQQRFGDVALIGAGTVLQTEQLTRLIDTGARLMVSPNTDTQLIRMAKKANMIALPGFFTASEAFAALAAGADALKLFPAEAMPSTDVIKALGAVIPKQVPIYPVGGVTPQNMAEYLRAGASGFGLGSSLYRAGQSVDDTRRHADAFVRAWRELQI